MKPSPAPHTARFLFLRGIGFIHLWSFASIALQAVPLLGRRGVLPASTWLDQVAEHLGAGWPSWRRVPTLFWFDASDDTLKIAAGLGLALAAALMVGVDGWPIVVALWALHLSFVHIGQIFWGYGWEMLLLEATTLAMLWSPLRPTWAWRPRAAPAPEVSWLLRWLLFRLMLGAGLIKLRGDECWRDLSCLRYHYETQPLPNPLSPWFHRLPPDLLTAGVLFNHFTELVVPFAYFLPGRARRAALLLTIAFQTMLILSGNLSYLNWLTIVLALGCMDEPMRRWPWSSEAAAPRPSRWIARGAALFIAWRSVGPVTNLLAPDQAMNRAFDPLYLVNTYGAFGTIGRTRDEIILEGTYDGDGKTGWTEIEFPCKPGDPFRRPCVVAPFQWRLDWQMWFAAMQPLDENPWLAHVLLQILGGDEDLWTLLPDSPFATRPPVWVRALRYRYHYAQPADTAWWTRSDREELIRPLRRDDPVWSELGQRYRWPESVPR